MRITFKFITNKFTYLIVSLFLIKGSYETFAQGFVCAIGGGSENYNDWSDAPYKWIVQKSDSGKIIIIGVSSADSWLPNYFMYLGADTAYNLTISSTAIANLQSTYNDLITAKAIFIRGGNQWDYIRLWKGTKTDSAINYVFNNGGVIAGTSAGASVLGEFDFSAKYGSVYPDESLINPFNTYMTFENNFLNLIPNVLFDTHFIERGRHARLIGMLYNIYFNWNRSLVGIGIDDRTAICISADGTCEIMGSGAVSIFTIDSETKFHPLNSGNYTIEKLKCDQLTNNWRYNLQNKSITFIPSSAKQVDTSRTWDMPFTNLWITGSNNLAEQISDNLPKFISNVNTNSTAIISHPGFSTQLAPLINYLNQLSINFQTIYLTTGNQNDTSITQIISNATNFIFAGDSMNVLSLLKDTTTSAGKSFRIKIIYHQTPIFFVGKSGKIAGEFYTDNLYSDIYSAYRGKMTNNTGLKIFNDFLFEPSLFEDSNHYENRVSSVLWGLMRNRKKLGLYLHGNSMIVTNSTKNSIISYGTMPPIYIDASKASYVDSSTYRASSSVGPRQVVAMNNLRYCISTYDGIKYSIGKGEFDNTSSVSEGNSYVIGELILYPNYPNPFNHTTKIEFRIPYSALITLKVYDILGREIATILNEPMQTGKHSVEWDASKLPSGVYIYKLTAGLYSQSKKMIFLK